MALQLREGRQSDERLQSRFQPSSDRRARDLAPALHRGGRGSRGAAAFLVAKPDFLRAQATGEPLKIGSFGPFTGPASRTGDEIKNGVNLALEDARAEGDLPLTLDGEEREVEIVFIDSQSSPEKAVRAVQDAITREGVQFLANGWHSSVAMAMTDAEAPYDIVHIGHLGKSSTLREDQHRPEKYRGWFKGWPAPPVLAGLYGPPLQHFMEAGLWQPANMKAAILVEDTDFGRGWGDAIIESLSAAASRCCPTT